MPWTLMTNHLLTSFMHFMNGKRYGTIKFRMVPREV